MSLNHITGQTGRPKSKSFSQEKTGSFTGSSKKGSGKSKYGKKQGQRKGQKPVAVKSPTRAYTSVCCSAPAQKPRCGKVESMQDAETKRLKEVSKGLGKWRCSACNKPCKVTSSPATVTVEVPIEKTL